MRERTAPVATGPGDEDLVPDAVRVALRVLTRLTWLLVVITVAIVLGAVVAGVVFNTFDGPDTSARVGTGAAVLVGFGWMPGLLTFMTARMAPAVRAGGRWPPVVLVVFACLGALPVLGGAVALVWALVRPGSLADVQVGGVAAIVVITVVPVVVLVSQVRAAVLLWRRPARAWAAEQRAAVRSDAA